VALQLLDRYFSLGDDFDYAQAYVDRAAALVALDRIGEAITSYEAALAREAEFPDLLTQAYLDLPWLIATRGIREEYERAIRVLRKHQARLMFFVDHFRWHAALALIAGDIRDRHSAKRHAKDAFDAAAREHSGFRYHPTVGLVTAQYDDLIRKLEEYCDND
jgi:tetratricopeptide (TPR) repeat protein